MNKRSLIRNAVETLLNSNLNSEGSDVTIIKSRSSQISQLEQLPSISIMTPDEAATPESINQKRYIRTLDLNLDVRVLASEDVDDVLDALIAEIEQIITDTPGLLTGFVLGTVLLRTSTDVGFEGNTEIGLGTLRYQCTYIA